MDRQLIRALWYPGTVSGCTVTPVTGMKIKMAPGLVVVEGKNSTNQGSYLALFESEEIKNVPARPASGSRIDIAAVVVTDTVDGIGSTNEALLTIYSGSSTTGTPVAPALPVSAQEVARWRLFSTDTEVSPAQLSPGPRSSVVGGVEPGIILIYAGVNLPSGYLWCRGQAEQRDQYPRLFDAISTLHGAGNGTSTFNVPNFQASYPLGFNTGTGTPSDLSNNVMTAALGARFGNRSSQLNLHSHDLTNHYHDQTPHIHPINIFTSYTDANHWHRPSQQFGGGYQFVIHKPGGGFGAGAAGGDFQLVQTTNWAEPEGTMNHRHEINSYTGYDGPGWLTGTARGQTITSPQGTDPTDEIRSGNYPPSVVVNFIIKT
jgi:microcystin-dependent protein